MGIVKALSVLYHENRQRRKNMKKLILLVVFTAFSALSFAADPPAPPSSVPDEGMPICYLGPGGAWYCTY